MVWNRANLERGCRIRTTGPSPRPEIVRSEVRAKYFFFKGKNQRSPAATWAGWPGQRGWQGSCLSCPAEFRRWLVILSTPCSIGWLLLRIEAGADFLVLIRTANTFKMDYRADRPLPNKVFFPLCLMVSNPFVIAWWVTRLLSSILM